MMFLTKLMVFGVSGEEIKGKVLQRFPAQDRKDVPFPEGIELVSSLPARLKSKL